MFIIKEVPSGIMLQLTDKDFLLQEFPDLDVGLYEAMEYCDFAPEGSSNEEWSDISGSIGHAAIGHGVIEFGIGELGYLPHIPHRMFEHPDLKPAEILKALVEKEQVLFTPFEFKPNQPSAAD